MTAKRSSHPEDSLQHDLRILGTTKLIERGAAGTGHPDAMRMRAATTFGPKYRTRRGGQPSFWLALIGWSAVAGALVYWVMS